jgi:D-alanine-D-alanine ligase-like ATP-grasp enzyme/L-alanine-DL-glutamate epimerase-like enolase superfamily enzyme/acylphosphatase
MSTSLPLHAPADTKARSGLQEGPAVVTRARGWSYRVPAEGEVKSNHVVALELTDPGGSVVEGLGEGQPRSALTGDSADQSWAFLEEVLQQLEGRPLTVEDEASARAQVRNIMAEFAELAHNLNSTPSQKRPFRGTLLGVETALLDGFARALGIPLYQVLGRVRKRARRIPPSLSTEMKLNALRRELIEQAGQHERVRLEGGKDTDQVADFMELVATVCRSRRVGQANRPLWLEMHGALDREHATEFISDMARSMMAGHLPTDVVIEQPVPARFADHLAALQQLADRTFSNDGHEHLKLTIMGDESIWDQHSLGRLKKLGGLRAVNIRPAQAGGLLQAIDLADAALAQSGDAIVLLSRMSGASRLTRSALEHLAVALPEVDAVSLSSFQHSTLPFATWVDDLVETDEFEDEEHYRTPWVSSSVPSDMADRDTEADDSDEDDEAEDSPASGDDGTELPPTVSGISQHPGEALQRPPKFPHNAYVPATSTPRGRIGNGLELDYPVLVGAVRRATQFPPMPEPRNEGKLPARYENVEDVRPLGRNGTKGYLLEKHALARGLSTTRYSKSAFAASDGVKPPVTFKWSRSPISSAVAISVCTHKEATRLMLEEAKAPTPRGRTFRNSDYESARQFVDLIGFPVVVKPSMGIRGIGVIAGIETTAQLEGAFALMSDSRFGGQDFIVEKHIKGRDHRILVVGGEVVGAIQRKPATVRGDGSSTVAELLIHRNVARRNNPHLWTKPAMFDDTMAHQLEKLGLSLKSVLPVGREVMLSNTANISQGADSIDVLDTLHPTIIEACKRAVAAVPGMQYCGVDFVLEDPAKAIDDQDAAIIELNAHAAIGNCEYPMFGTSRPVAEKLLELTVAQQQLHVDGPFQELTVHLTVHGGVTKVGFRKWLQQHAEKAEILGWARNLNARTVEAVLHGPTDRVTPLVAACILGPTRALPTSYDARVLPKAEAELGEGFEIRPRPKQNTLPFQVQREMEAAAEADTWRQSAGSETPKGSAGEWKLR